MSDAISGPSYDPVPEDVASWLALNGWECRSQSGSRPSLWSQGSRELLQPTLRDAGDYQLRLSQMFRSLASWTNRPIESLAEEMVHEGSDVSEWRAVGLGVSDYSIPLEDGLILVQSVRNAFVAAANASIQRRGYFGHSTLKAAREHARAVRMGQTRRGSYVVPIISRVPGAAGEMDERQGRLDIEVSAQPFERRVMAQLAEALVSVQALAVQSDRVPTKQQLNESVGSGVSHELCAAVESMLAARSFGDLEVSFSWARRATSHPDVSRVEFPEAARGIIRVMAEGLRGSDVIAQQTLSGTIWQTKYETGEVEGSIKVRTQIGKQARTIRVPLNAEQIHEAYGAASEDKPVFIRGQLVREIGRSWYFESVSEFGVAEAAPLSWREEEPEAVQMRDSRKDNSDTGPPRFT